MLQIEIVPYSADRRDNVLRLALRAWRPVFARTADVVPRYVYDAFYPGGWEERQSADVASFLDTEGGRCWLASHRTTLLGFVGLRLHPEDRMGESLIMAVDPDHVGRRPIESVRRHPDLRGVALA
jgi:hypothetical protein